jgi:hypothetical protein
MNDTQPGVAAGLDRSIELSLAGRRAARLIWEDDEAFKKVADPRKPAFAQAVIDELGTLLRQTPRVLQQVMAGAASAAEDLNVEPFQRLIEVIQNADDLAATEVRFTVREQDDRLQLLIVHDGTPVIFSHVLAMTLPFLTTKTDDAHQKGRWGIGLKTLARISSRLCVHSSPYHFSAENLAISACQAEAPLHGFYTSPQDTMLVLDLTPDFDTESLKQWFAGWDEDGLLFGGRLGFEFGICGATSPRTRSRLR